MLLQELLNNPQRLKVLKSNHYDFVASAVIDGRKFKFLAAVSDVADNIWEVQFVDERGSSGITGKGNALEVLATAHKFIQQLIKVKHPNAIEFSASLKKADGEKSSRAGAYTRMFTRDSFGYKFSHKDTDVERLFTLELPNK